MCPAQNWRLNSTSWETTGSVPQLRLIKSYSVWTPPLNTGSGLNILLLVLLSTLTNTQNIIYSIHISISISRLYKSYFRYQSESAELRQWLSSALDRLEFWSTQSVTVPQELETVRDHLHAFLVRTSNKYCLLARLFNQH